MNAGAARASAIIEAGGLQVRFDSAAGQVRHSIWMVGDGQVEFVLESVEDDREPTEPGVPVLREVHVESRDGRRQVALLVGMSGSDHWSMSVEADPAAGLLSFDVACRIHTESTPRGSIYRVVPPATVSETGPAELSHPGAGAMQLIAGGSELPADGDGWRFEKPERLQLTAIAASTPLPRTVRWKYGFRRIDR